MTLRMPPPGARIEGEGLTALLGILWKALVNFVKKHRKPIFIVLCVLLAALYVLDLVLTPGATSPNLNPGLITAYVALLIGHLLGAGMAYLGFRWSIRSWRQTNTWLMVPGVVISILGLVLMAACPLIWQWLWTYQHAVYDCMKYIGDNSPTLCYDIVSNQHNRQPPWSSPFYKFVPGQR